MPKSAKQNKERRERDQQVIAYKARGLTFQQIADKGIPGVGTRQQAKICFDRGLKDITQVAADQYRSLENQKLDMLEKELVDIYTNHDFETRERLKAAATMIGVLKRRADLNGLDAQPSMEGGNINTVFVSGDVLTKTIHADEPPAIDAPTYDPHVIEGIITHANTVKDPDDQD